MRAKTTLAMFTMFAALAAGLLAHGAAAHAADTWSHSSRPGHLASASNRSGHVFGQQCNAGDGRCTYVLAIPARCEDGETYPLLANSDSSANVVEVVCDGPFGRRAADGRALYRYVLLNFASVDHQVRHSRRIGFAFPLERDGILVSRFSLAGAVEAIAAMRSAAGRAAGAR
jgi:hypothetical protein